MQISKRPRRTSYLDVKEGDCVSGVACIDLEGIGVMGLDMESGYGCDRFRGVYVIDG